MEILPVAPLSSADRLRQTPIRFFTGFGEGGFASSLIAALRGRGLDATLCSRASTGAYRAGSRLGGLGSLASRLLAEPARMLRAAGAPGLALNVVATNPFYAPWLALGAGGGSKSVAWMLDLYPQAPEAAGVPLRPLWQPFLRAMAARVLRESAAAVFMGEGLADSAESRLGSARLRAVIPFGADDGIFEAQLRPATCPVEFLYCGNMGRLHEVDTLAAALHMALAGGADGAVRFTFAASGKGFGRFRRLMEGVADSGAVRLQGPKDGAGWIEGLRAAHVGWVTMRPGAENAILPSKLFSAMAAGQAILSVTPRDSDVARLVARHQIGWNFEPGDAAGVAGLIRNLSRDAALLEGCRARSRKAALELFSAKALALEWVKLFDQVLAEDGRGSAQPG